MLNFILKANTTTSFYNKYARKKFLKVRYLHAHLFLLLLGH